jgi:hypothetical protein
MSTTTPRGIVVPASSDTDNVPGDLGSLASFVDPSLTGTAARMILLKEGSGTPVSNSVPAVRGTWYQDTSNGNIWAPVAGSWQLMNSSVTVGGAASTSAPGDSASNGTSGAAAAADHKHAREGFGSPGASVPGDGSASGVSTSLARADHQHAREAYGTSGQISAISPGASAAGGSAAGVARPDHAHAAPAFGASSDVQPLTFGGTASAGSSMKFADAGHKHAMPAAPTSILALHRYGPGSQVAPAAGASGVWGAFDSTNMTVTAVAPSSGQVLVRFQGWATNSGGAGYFYLGLVLHGTSTRVGDAVKVNSAYVGQADFVIAGLTAGASYSWDLAGLSANSSSIQVLADGRSPANLTDASNGLGSPVFLTVFAA